METLAWNGSIYLHLPSSYIYSSEQYRHKNKKRQKWTLLRLLFKIDNVNTRKSCKIYLKETIKTPKRFHWRCSGVLIVNFEHIPHLLLVCLLLILSRLVCGMWLSCQLWTYTVAQLTNVCRNVALNFFATDFEQFLWV